MSRGSTLTALLTFQCGLLWGQTIPPAGQFDVASIKPSSLDQRKSIVFTPAGGFKATNYSLNNLITFGWDVRNFQIAGGSAWLDSDRYDVAVRTASPVDASQPGGARELRLMVQSLLEDRFQLRVHRATKEMNVYFLVPGSKGVRLRKTAESTGPETSMHDGKGFMAGTLIDMRILAANLASELGVGVIDRANFGGAFDFRLEWNPDEDSTAGPSIFTAVREQLGLRLQPGKAPMEVVVVDSAERPSAN